ncbi:hypothetical protein B0T24DRAFT_658091 [Lasiosphaeria ovina]|uniref:RBR-type E3 ubiquitin transferase n=1 Tax=Lasiosphaeria ovina TaxID=92902 RepID=A0AAE0K7M9_9PEZI|nr:hypothetical protein B0T24DRAFT_658091 [Lasiosphaeria ovina]
MDLESLDAQTLRVVLELQLQDIQALKESKAQKGKGREGETSDLEIALDTLHTNLLASVQLLADEAMAESIASAVGTDADVIRSTLAEEAQAAKDRAMALRLGGRCGEEAYPPPNAGVPLSAVNDETLDTWLDVNMRETYINEGDGQPESSSRAEKRKHPMNGTVGCVSCGDTFLSWATIKCSSCPHDYCRGCMESLFRASMTDESLFPPRCCGQSIPIETTRPFFSPQLVGEFNAKKLEYETPNRTYCHESACSLFIPPQFIHDGVAACIRCPAQTCTTCKGAAHQGNECPEDPAVQEILRVAAANGWQRCYSCRRLVELSTGCNHMTCFCRAQFCYECGVHWKRCECPQWDEARLIHRAGAILNRNPGILNTLNEEERVVAVEQQRNHLEENHNCNHPYWKVLRGCHDCDECNQSMPLFIYECLQCQIAACKRCRFNRL